MLFYFHSFFDKCMEKIFKQLLQSIGEDINREGFRKTPERAARAFKELTKGYQENIGQVINDAIFNFY